MLISAPTGSGKTLAAFLICLDRLIARAAGGGMLDDQTEVVYVSPLKALSNDIHRNLEVPLTEITTLATEIGLDLSTIRTDVRTGDTRSWEREEDGTTPAPRAGDDPGVAVHSPDGRAGPPRTPANPDGHR